MKRWRWNKRQKARQFRDPATCCASVRILSRPRKDGVGAVACDRSRNHRGPHRSYSGRVWL